MEEVKKVGVLSLAKVTTLFGTLIGLVGYLLMWGVAKFGSDIIPGLVQVPFSVKTLFSTVIIYAAMYFVGGILIAWLYNMFAKLVGGIKVELGTAKAGKKK